MSLDVELQLREILDMDENEFAQYFKVYEKDGDVVVEVQKDTKGESIWVEPATWRGVNTYVKQKAGAWIPNERKWLIPVENVKKPKVVPGAPSQEKPSAPIPLKQPKHVILETEEEELRDLSVSERVIGQIYPVIKDQFGNILDGLHRKRLNPNWKETVVEVKDPLQALRIRVHANLVRRRVEWGEKHQWVMEARRILNPQNPMEVTQEEVAKALGVTQQWVSKYDKVLHERVNLLHRSKKSQETRQPSTGFEFNQINEAIKQAPEEVQPRLREVVAKQRFTPEETLDLVSVIKETPKEKWSEVLLTPRTIIQAYRAKVPKIRKPKPQEFDVGEFKCPHCGFTALIVHVEPDRHKFVKVSEK